MSARELALEMLEEENRERPDVVRLARALSVAARVEPALLRRLRTRLFPEMDPGAESDVWFSPLVESAGYGGFVLDPAVAGVLRESLAADHREHAGPPGSSLLSRVEAVLAEVHGARLPSIWAEEQATLMALRGDPPEAMEAVLRPAAKAMLESDERGLEVARWALRALPRLPEAARRTEAAAMLALGASARLGGRPVATAPDTDGAALSPHLAWALPPERLSERTELSVRLLRGGIEFLAPDSELPVVSLPRTHPLLVQLSWSTPAESGRKLAQAQAGKTVELPEAVDEVTLRTLAGDEYDLRATGPGASGEPALALDERYAWAVDALVRVGSSQDRESLTTGWIPAPGRVVTAASAFRDGVPYLHVIWRDRHVPARVVARDDEADLLLLELVEPPDDARLSLTPLPGAFTRMEEGQPLTVLAFHRDQPFSLELRLLRAYADRAEAGLVGPRQVPGGVSRAVAGAPVLMGQVTVGFVWLDRLSDAADFDPRERPTGVFDLRDADAVQRLLQAPAGGEETPRQSAPEPAEAGEGAEAPRSTDDAATAPPAVFISYSRRDAAWMERLQVFLRPYERRGLLSVRDDRSMRADGEWETELRAAEDAAKVAVLLVSADSLASEFVAQEVSRLLQRRDREGLRIVPVLVEPCDWEAVDWLRDLLILPRSGEPLSLLPDPEADRALVEIVREVAALLAEPPGNAAAPPDEGDTRPVTQAGRPPESQAPAPRVFDNVWYSPEQYGIFSGRAPDTGTLTVHADRIEYRGELEQVSISAIQDVEHVRMGGDIRKNWVRVRYQRRRELLEAFFADASRAWLGNLRGGSKEIYEAIEALGRGTSGVPSWEREPGGEG